MRKFSFAFLPKNIFCCMKIFMGFSEDFSMALREKLFMKTNFRLKKLTFRCDTKNFCNIDKFLCFKNSDWNNQVCSNLKFSRKTFFSTRIFPWILQFFWRTSIQLIYKRKHVHQLSLGKFNDSSNIGVVKTK